MRRHTRGHVLVTALFICMMMYLLAAALVSTSREDFKYSLTTTSRARARAACTAGTNTEIAALKSQASPPAADHGVLPDGATWNATSDAASPCLTTVTSQGESGTVTASDRIVLERLQLCKSLAADEEIDVFAWTLDGNLARMGPSFTWESLGPSPGGRNWLVAHEGPLFTQTGPDTGRSSTPISDFNPYRDANNIAWPGTLAVTHLPDPQTAQDEHVVTLAMEKGTAHWNDLPDPGVGLGHDRGVLIAGTPDGQVAYGYVEVRGRRLAYISSSFNGPKRDWYALRGNAMTANGTTVYCHAVHYCYIGWFFQNHVSVSKGAIVSNPTWQPPRLLTAPAVLSTDSRTPGTWVRVVDGMQVDDGEAPPRLVQTERPDLESLGVAAGQVYACKQGDDNALLVARNDHWQREGSIESPSLGLYTLDDRLATHVSEGDASNGLPRVSLGQLSPESQLSYEQGPMTASVQHDGAWETSTVVPGVSFHASLLADVRATAGFTTPSRGANCVASVGSDVYSWSRFRRRWTKPGGPVLSPFDLTVASQWQPVDTLALTHYDGTTWQVWPGGVDQQVDAEACTVANALPVSDGDLDADHLAVAVYPRSAPTRSRYVPIPGQP